MKARLTALGAFLAVAAFVYLVIAFIMAAWNPLVWGIGARIVTALMTVVFGIVVAAAAFTIVKAEEGY